MKPKSKPLKNIDFLVGSTSEVKSLDVLQKHLNAVVKALNKDEGQRNTYVVRVYLLLALDNVLKERRNKSAVIVSLRPTDIRAGSYADFVGKMREMENVHVHEIEECTPESKALEERRKFLADFIRRMDVSPTKDSDDEDDGPKPKKYPENAVILVPNRATLMLLFHIYVFGSEFERSQTNVEALEWLKGHQMIRSVGKVKAGQNHQYELTDKGMFWMNTLMETPLPVPVTTFTIPTKG